MDEQDRQHEARPSGPAPGRAMPVVDYHPETADRWPWVRIACPHKTLSHGVANPLAAMLSAMGAPVPPMRRREVIVGVLRHGPCCDGGHPSLNDAPPCDGWCACMDLLWARYGPTYGQGARIHPNALLSN